MVHPGIISWTRGWTLLVCCVASLVSASSNLSLLSGTLKTFQVYACEDTELKIECVPNTVINIYFAHYTHQTSVQQLCPPKDPNLNTSDCVVGQALQYNLLQSVEAACREQRVCHFRSHPEASGPDPCPGVRKFIEVAYKCRPNSFSNRIVCEGDRLRLKCQNNLRIVIFSAMFGSTHYGVAECAMPDEKHGDECQVSYATETVMSNCHGRRKCSVGADIGTFGNPGCPKGNRLYLKVVYTCIPKEILIDLDLGGNEDAKDSEDSDYTGFIEEPRYVPVTSMPMPVSPSSSHREDTVKFAPDNKLQAKPTLKPSVAKAGQNNKNESSHGLGFLTEWMSTYNYLTENKERFILYVCLCVGSATVLFIGVILGRQYFIRRKKRQAKTVVRRRSKLSLSLQSEDDPCEMERYEPTGVRFSRSSLRRQDSDSQPRAPISPELTNFYYS